MIASEGRFRIMNTVRMHLRFATIHSGVLTSTVTDVHTRLLPPMHVLTCTETVIGAASQGAIPVAGRQLGTAAMPRVVSLQAAIGRRCQVYQARPRTNTDSLTVDAMAADPLQNRSN
jgi:hypothetical protein